MSGRLVKGGAPVLARLSHLSLSLFRFAEDGSEDVGKLITTLHISELISIRKTKGPSSPTVSIGDAEGGVLVLRAPSEVEASKWVDTILQTKNELLDAVRQLDLSAAAEPHVLLVTASCLATLGPYDVVVSRNVAFRSPFRLPFLSARTTSVLVLQLSHGTLRLTGMQLHDLALASAKDPDKLLWVQAVRLPGSSYSSKRLHVCMRVGVAPESCPVGILGIVSFVAWLRGAPFVPTEVLALPPMAAWCSEFMARQPSLRRPAIILACVGCCLVAIGVARARAEGAAAAIEGVLAAGTGALALALAAIARRKGDDVSELAHRFTLTLVSFSWTDDEPSPREPASAATVALAACPPRFLRMVRGDAESALAWWAKTQQWRATVQPDRLLRDVPRASFVDIKADIEHFFHKRDRSGRIVYYEVLRNPRVAFKSLKEKGWSVEDVVEHMCFVNEATYRKIVDDYDEIGVEPTTRGQMIKVMDIQSLGLGDVGGDVSAYFNRVSILGKNYPERLDKILIINVPAAFGMIWNIVAPMLDRNVRERISIHRGDFSAALEELIDPANIPEHYGGQCRCPGEGGCRHNSPEEQALGGLALGTPPGVPAAGDPVETNVGPVEILSDD